MICDVAFCTLMQHLLQTVGLAYVSQVWLLVKMFWGMYWLSMAFRVSYVTVAKIVCSLQYVVVLGKFLTFEHRSSYQNDTAESIGKKGSRTDSAETKTSVKPAPGQLWLLKTNTDKRSRVTLRAAANGGRPKQLSKLQVLIVIRTV